MLLNSIKSNHILSRIIKEYREQTGRTIYAISAETSIPRSTWRDIEFEVSCDTNITNFCRIIIYEVVFLCNSISSI